MSVDMAQPDGTPWVPAAGCDIDDYTATITTAPTYGAMAVDDNVSGTATVTLAESGLNQDACKGAEVPLRFVAS